MVEGYRMCDLLQHTKLNSRRQAWTLPLPKDNPSVECRSRGFNHFPQVTQKPDISQIQAERLNS